MKKPFKFPDLEGLCRSLLHDIVNNRVFGSVEALYDQSIARHGGTEPVIPQLLSLIRPEILKLQGQPVCRKSLDQVRQQQQKDEDWNGSMGYLDYITDARNRNTSDVTLGNVSMLSVASSVSMPRKFCGGLLRLYIILLPGLAMESAV